MKFMNIKLKSKLTSLIICITLVFSSFITASAQVNNNSSYASVKQYAQAYMKKYKSNSILKDPIKLYNMNNDVVALFFSDKTGGYIIINVDDKSIPEFSPSYNNKYIVDNSKKYFYNGPVTYMEEENGQIVDLNNNLNLGTLYQVKSKLKGKVVYGEAEKKNSFSVNKTSSQNLNLTSGYDYWYTIMGSVPTYSYNPNSICGSTAAAMYLRYYDYYINDNYVPTSISSSDEVLLINYLVPYIDGSTPGSTPGELQTGITNYLRGRGIYTSIYLDVLNMGIVAGLVGNDRPFIAGLNNHPVYTNHWVTGYGYAGNSSGSYIIVNDGWGASNVYINTIYTDYIVY